MANFTDIIKESFSQYAGAVIQSRALVDVRDCLKPSARQIFYAMETDKFTHNKPFKKTLKAIGSAFRFYIHGDSSAEGIIMRASQPFAMRYPLVEVEGSYGNLMESANWAATRYTAARLSPFSDKLFEDIAKETIEDWRDNYDDTEKYPSVLPTKGYYNIVNGTFGIGVSLASSIPQFNLREVNAALIKLLKNPQIDFDEIYCEPDFATGGILINSQEVKKSLQTGNGKACMLRAKFVYDEKKNTLTVTEMPYNVYTNTVCQQLEKIVNGDDNPGIKTFNDLTGSEPCIKIYLEKGVSHTIIENYLYKNTSLQNPYGINLTMLDNGKYPKVFTWKEALQAYIDHQLIVYRRGFEFDLAKLEHRKMIIEAIIKAIAKIEEVITTIKSSSSTSDANIKLQSLLNINEEQAKAILDIKLARLARLEVDKYENELKEVCAEIGRITKILSDDTLFRAEIIKDLEDVANKYGDERRTVITNIEIPKDKKKKERAEIVPESVVIHAHKNYIKRVPAASIKVSRRSTKGVKSDSDLLLSFFASNTQDYIYAFTDKGRMYGILCDKIPSDVNTVYSNLFKIAPDEQIISVTSLSYSEKMPQYIIFVTKNGQVKKILLSDCQTNRTTGIKVIGLSENDSIISVLFVDNENVIMSTEKGFALRFDTSKVNTQGKIAKGVKGIKLSDGDSVVSALIVDNTKKFGVFYSDGRGKKIEFSEINPQTLNTKGVQLISKNNDLKVAGTATLSDEDNVFLSGEKNITISAKDIPLVSKLAIGNILIKGNIFKAYVI